MYVCMYVYVCTYAYMYVRMYACIYYIMYVCMYVGVYVCMYVRTRACKSPASNIVSAMVVELVMLGQINAMLSGTVVIRR